MFEIGRICVKLAGRDAGKKCVVVDVIDDVYVMIDGQTRRRKANREHLEPLEKKVKLDKNADNTKVCEALKKIGIECKEKASMAQSSKQDKEKSERPKRIHKAKEKPVKEAKAKKSDAKAKDPSKKPAAKPAAKKAAKKE